MKERLQRKGRVRYKMTSVEVEVKALTLPSTKKVEAVKVAGIEEEEVEEEEEIDKRPLKHLKLSKFEDVFPNKKGRVILREYVKEWPRVVAQKDCEVESFDVTWDGQICSYKLSDPSHNPIEEYFDEWIEGMYEKKYSIKLEPHTVHSYKFYIDKLLNIYTGDISLRDSTLLVNLEKYYTWESIVANCLQLCVVTLVQAFKDHGPKSSKRHIESLVDKFEEEEEERRENIDLRKKMKVNH